MTDDELDDKIEAWHDSHSPETLHAHLGWTWEQYQHWVLTNEQPS